MFSIFSLNYSRFLKYSKKSKIPKRVELYPKLNRSYSKKKCPTENDKIERKTIFSGIQPTGEIHLGNYLGAISNWVNLQNDPENDIIISVVDMHSITTEAGRKNLFNCTYDVTATLLACGIDPDRTVLYNQSRVSGHAELTWILLSIVPLSDLNAMIQYKEKSFRHGCLGGLYSYPVLMASDILLYKSTHVPVGDDQIQHVELVRKLAQKFNRQFGKLFPIPTLLHTSTRRIMSLKDGSKKMSKSDLSNYSRISLLDSADLIAAKIKRSKTDSNNFILYDKINRPEIANLYEIFSACSGITIDELEKKYRDRGIIDFKKDLTDSVVAKISPITKKIIEYKRDKEYVDKILDEGTKKALQKSKITLDQVRELVGFY